jgi:hypothetical protein
MRRNTWTYTVQVTLEGKKEKTEEQLAKILNRKAIVKHKVIHLRNEYTGGTHYCPETLYDQTIVANQK